MLNGKRYTDTSQLRDKYVSRICELIHAEKERKGYTSFESLDNVLRVIIANPKLLLTFCKLQGDGNEILRETMYIPHMRIYTTNYAGYKSCPYTEYDDAELFGTLNKYHSPYRVFNQDRKASGYGIVAAFMQKEVKNSEQFINYLAIREEEGTFYYHPYNLSWEEMKRLLSVFHRVMVNSVTLIAA